MQREVYLLKLFDLLEMFLPDCGMLYIVDFIHSGNIINLGIISMILLKLNAVPYTSINHLWMIDRVHTLSTGHR